MMLPGVVDSTWPWKSLIARSWTYVSLSLFGLSAIAAGVAASASAAIAINAVSRRCFISLPLPFVRLERASQADQQLGLRLRERLARLGLDLVDVRLDRIVLKLHAHGVRDAFLRDELLRER